IEYEIALAQTFQEANSRLQASHQAAVFEAIRRLQGGHGSVHLHSLSPLPWTSFCVNRDAVRIICHREGATLLLAWVALHDHAYRGAKPPAPRRFGNVVRLVTVSVEGEEVAPTVATVDAPPGPLCDVSDKTFRRIDIGPRVAAALRDLPS